MHFGAVSYTHYPFKHEWFNKSSGRHTSPHCCRILCLSISSSMMEALNCYHWWRHWIATTAVVLHASTLRCVVLKYVCSCIPLFLLHLLSSKNVQWASCNCDIDWTRDAAICTAGIVSRSWLLVIFASFNVFLSFFCVCRPARASLVPLACLLNFCWGSLPARVFLVYFPCEGRFCSKVDRLRDFLQFWFAVFIHWVY